MDSNLFQLSSTLHTAETRQTFSALSIWILLHLLNIRESLTILLAFHPKEFCNYYYFRHSLLVLLCKQPKQCLSFITRRNSNFSHGIWVVSKNRLHYSSLSGSTLSENLNLIPFFGKNQQNIFSVIIDGCDERLQIECWQNTNFPHSFTRRPISSANIFKWFLIALNIVKVNKTEPRNWDWVSWKILFKFQSQLISCMFKPNSTEWLKFMKLRREWRAVECLKRVAWQSQNIFRIKKPAREYKFVVSYFSEWIFHYNRHPLAHPSSHLSVRGKVQTTATIFHSHPSDRTWNFASGRLTYVR